MVRMPHNTSTLLPQGSGRSILVFRGQSRQRNYPVKPTIGLVNPIGAEAAHRPNEAMHIACHIQSADEFGDKNAEKCLQFAGK